MSALVPSHPAWPDRTRFLLFRAKIPISECTASNARCNNKVVSDFELRQVGGIPPTGWAPYLTQRSLVYRDAVSSRADSSTNMPRLSDYIVTGLLLLSALYVWRRRAALARNPRGLPLPPGPRGLPVIKNLLQWPQGNAWRRFSEWRKVYGVPPVALI